MALKIVGFWEEVFVPSTPGPGFPHPRHFVDPTWQLENKTRIVAYLRSGRVVCEYLGYGTDRFDDTEKPEFGCADLSDGTWLWPEGLWIYVARYNVRLPDEFVAHMAANSFAIPPELDAEAISSQEPFDEGPWRRWCDEELAQRSVTPLRRSAG